MNYFKKLTLTLTPVLLTAALSGCGSSDTPAPEESSSSTPVATPTATESSHTANAIADGTCYQVSDVDRISATDVAQAFSAVSYCWDSTVDGRTTDGMLRAQEIMSPEFYQTQAQSQTRNMLQAQFNEAYKHQGYTSVKVSQTPGDTNQDIDTDKAVRGVSTQWAWAGRDGQTLPGGTAQDNVYLEQRDGQWVVVAVDNTLMDTK